MKFSEDLVGACTKRKMVWNKKRRSQRIVLSVSVVAYRSQKQDLAFSEGTRTLVVNAHGALIILTAKVAIKQTLLLKNALTGEEQECRVVFTQKKEMGSTEVGIEFRDPAPGFWHIAFPPIDWAPNAVPVAPAGVRTNSNISDISQRGCFVETDSPFSLGMETTLRITKGTEAFEARARVVHSGTNGMGLLFTAVVQEQLRILERWLIPFRQKEWLALHRHRTQRVLLQIPVRVSGRNALGSPFEEESQTVVVNANGALLLLSTQMSQGQTLTLLNIAAQQSAECVVAYIGQHQGQRAEVGVGFLLPNPGFWHVNFPPRDWTRPSA